MVTVLLAESALFAAALAIFGALAAILRIRAAHRRRRDGVAQHMRDEAAAADRVSRRLAELAPGRNGPRPQAAPALAAPATAPRTVGGNVLRRRPRLPDALVTAGILVVLLVGVIAVARPSHSPSGGVLGVRGVPGSNAPSGTGPQVSEIGTGIAVQGLT